MLPPALQDRQAHDRRQRDGARGDDRTPTASRPASPTSTPRSNAEHQVRAQSSCSPRAAASRRACCSTRSRRGFPNGLANSSGVVGKYLTDSTGLSVSGFIPALLDLPRYNSDGVGGMHLYVPWWGDNKALGFPRGYHIELGGGFGMPGYGFRGGIQNYPQSRGGGYGADLKDEYRRYYGAFVNFAGRGEQVAARRLLLRDRSATSSTSGAFRCCASTTRGAITSGCRRSTCRRPSARIITGDGRRADLADADQEQDYGLAVGGLIIHEAGATRMGNDPKTSVLNPNCQAHDVKNLFVADGGPFVSQADKNLTWTIMALAWRTSEYIADERRKGNL